MRSIAAAALALAVLAPLPAAAAVYGLVIGVDNYVGTAPLRGAVNDAQDIAQSLRHDASAEVDLLVDADATRANVLASWEHLLATAQKGDTIVFSFAGHGAQEPDHPPMDELDGYDEVFLLQPFAEEPDAKFGEKLIDDELFDWAKQAEDKGITLIYVFDACHSGIPMRGIDPRAAEGEEGYSGFRFTRYKTRPTEPAKVDEANLAHLDFGQNIVALGATDESLRVREQRVEGKPRGVLSWAVARAFEGSADENKDKEIESDELVNYVRRTVFDRARHRQIPQFAAPSTAVRLLAVVPDEGATDKAERAEAPGVSVFAESGALGGMTLPGVNVVGDRADADYIWDASTGDLIDDGGDVIAFALRDKDLGVALKAQRLRLAISTLIDTGNALDITLSPDNKTHCIDQTLTVSGQSASLHHYTAFNITGEGEIQYLWPLSKFDDPEELDGPWSFDTKVGAPFGADSVVLIASDKPLERLHAVLEFSSQVLDPLDLWSLLQSSLEGTKFQIAVQGIFTRDRNTPGSSSCDS